MSKVRKNQPTMTMTLDEAMEGLKNGTLFEIIDMHEALNQIDRGESVLSPFSPPELEALQELYGAQNVQEFIKRNAVSERS